MSSHRSPNSMKILDRTPKGDMGEGFVTRDTGTRKVILVHPGMGPVVEKLEAFGDVYVHRMTPPHTFYIIERENWDDLLEGLHKSVEDLQRGYKRG